MRLIFSVFKTSLKSAAVGVLLMLFCSQGAASEFVKAEGSGETKNESLHDAQRNAVSQALGVMLSSQTMVENFILLEDKIFTKVKGYVKEYNIISQVCDQTGCTSIIRAKVEEAELADDVAALTHILPRMNFPTIVVSVTQKELTTQLGSVGLDISTVELAMGRAMSAKGFRIAEASALEAEKLRQANLAKMTGNTLGSALEIASHLAQVIVSGQAVVQDNGASPFNDKIHSYGAFLSVKAYQTGTGQLLASTSAEANVPHHSFAIGSQKVLEMAAGKAVEKLSDQIIQAWLDDCYNDHDITLVVENIPFSKLGKLKNMITTEIKGVTRVSQKSYLQKRAELLVGWRNCNTQRFAEKISEIPAMARLVEITEVQGNIIRFIYSDAN